MAMARDMNVLSNVRDVVLPAVWAVSAKAAQEGIPVLDADIVEDHLRDHIMLGVRYRLLSRRDLDTGDWKGEIGARLQAAMRLFHRMPAAKAICVDRRRLVARGEKARKDANRPTRKPVKRRHT